jgi:hypothetical protein
MRTQKTHNQAGCDGRLVRVSERPGRNESLIPVGYVCKSCGMFIPDEGAMKTMPDLKLTIESVASEIQNLLLDRQLYDRYVGIVRANDTLMAAVQRGNFFLHAVRRWWAVSAALTLRRQIDGSQGSTLRSVVEALADESNQFGLPVESARRFAADLTELQMVSDRFRPYLNRIVHGAGPSSANSLTFNDVGDAIDTCAKITQRAYAAVTNISLLLQPVVVDEWTDIFSLPWIANDTPMAYNLGAPGVPFDALPMTEHEARDQARLDAFVNRNVSGGIGFDIANVGKRGALDLRVFLPYAGTVIDLRELPPGKRASGVVKAPRSTIVVGQAVLEFVDKNGAVYRQYADVCLSDGTIRNLSKIAYKVSERIVAPGPAGVA